MTNPNMASNQVSLPLHAVQAADLAVFLSVLNAQTAAFLRASGFTAKPGELALLPGSAGLAGAVIGGCPFLNWCKRFALIVHEILCCGSLHLL